MLGTCLLYVDDEVRFEPDHVGNDSSWWFILILDSKFGYSRKNGRLGIQYICLFEVRNKTAQQIARKQNLKEHSQFSAQVFKRAGCHLKRAL